MSSTTPRPTTTDERPVVYLTEDLARDTDLGRKAAERIERQREESLARTVGTRTEGIIASRLIDESEPVTSISWVIPGFAARGYLTILAGRAGTGKSTLALQLGADLERQTGLRALYLDIENGDNHLRQLTSLMNIVGKVDLVDMGGYSLADADTLEQLTREVLGRGIATLATEEVMGSPLVVIDSLRRFAPGKSENSSDDMAPYIADLTTFAKRTRAAVVLIHHASTKNDAPAMRGSSAIEDQADNVLILRRHRGVFELAPTDKFRAGLKPGPVYYTRESEPHWRWIETSAPTQRDAPVAEPLEDALRLLAASEDASAGLTPLELREHLRLGSSDAERKAMSRALQKTGWTKGDDGRWRPLIE